MLGRLHVADTANNVAIQELTLDGRNGDNLPSPTVNGDNAAFRDNDVTNRHTSICFLLGSREYGRAKGTVIERNRIHNCGLLPPTNHHHGIYIEAADGARIIDNWIYDNADRGIQMFPDAQRSYIARNVLDGNGQNVVFSRDLREQRRGEQRHLQFSRPLQHRGLRPRGRGKRRTSQLPVEHAPSR